MIWLRGPPRCGPAPAVFPYSISIVLRSGLVHPLLLICLLLIGITIGGALDASLYSILRLGRSAICAFVGRGMTRLLICISHLILVASRVGSHWIEAWDAPMSVYCSAILVRALLARHLLLRACVLVGRKLLPQDALIRTLFSLVATSVISFFSVAVTAATNCATQVHVNLVCFPFMLFVSVKRSPRCFFVEKSLSKGS